MNFIGNVIWFIFGGFLAGLGYILGGLLICLTVIGIPFGMQAIKLGLATMAPFGKEIVVSDDEESGRRMLFDIIWIVLFGWEIAVAHLASAAVLAITIVGIPFARQHIKLIPVAFLPFSRDLR